VEEGRMRKKRGRIEEKIRREGQRELSD